MSFNCEAPEKKINCMYQEVQKHSKREGGIINVKANIELSASSITDSLWPGNNYGKRLQKHASEMSQIHNILHPKVLKNNEEKMAWDCQSHARLTKG